MPQSLSLDQRMQGVVEILAESNYVLSRSGREDYFAKFTGFVQEDPNRIAKVVKFLREMHPNMPLVSLDLGCGDGAWTLLAAVAGFQSYGLDANGYLISKARKNHEKAVKEGFVEPTAVCKFAAGNIYMGAYLDDFAHLADDNTKGRLPTGNFGKPYDELGISVGDADVIYSYQWLSQMPFLCNFLAAEAKQTAIFAMQLYRDLLTHKVETNLNLRGLDAELPFFVGKEQDL